MATNYTVSNGWTLSGTKLYSGVTTSTVNLTSGDTVTVSKGGLAEALTLSGGETLSVTSGVTSNIIISSGGEEQLFAGANATSTTVFAGGEDTIEVANPTNNALLISSGGILDIDYNAGKQNAAATLLSGSEILFQTTSGATVATSGANPTSVTYGLQKVVIAGSATISTLSTVTSNVFVEVTCFAGGTQILAGGNEVAIEALQPGDSVAVLRNGETVQEPVTWVGSSKIDLSRHAQPELAAPVRVKAGALADNTPTRDLLLSPEHCLILGGRSIPVKYLINGGSIAREYPAAPFHYYHVELENHGILIAEGAQAESYLDTGNRASFDNAGTPRLLHPTFEVNPTSERWTTEACAPLAVVPDEVAPVWEALAERSASLGLEVLPPEMAEDPDLHILADGQRIQPISDRNSRFVFMVPAGTQSVTLASRYCIPADKMIASQRDTRRLGVRVNWMAVRSDDTETILSADHPALQAGWNAVEGQGKSISRWTDGAATIPWENVAGAAVLTVCCEQIDQYPLYAEKARLVA
nr:Hint domain-containing protein [uncultured Rhodopila sp.]